MDHFVHFPSFSSFALVWSPDTLAVLANPDSALPSCFSHADVWSEEVATWAQQAKRSNSETRGDVNQSDFTYLKKTIYACLSRILSFLFQDASEWRCFPCGENRIFSEIRPFIVMFTYTTNGIQTKQERNLITVLVMRRLFMRRDFV